jgi:hypothetical protein
MYIAITWWIVRSFKYHRFGVATFLILIIPFIYPLVYGGSVDIVLWMLIFTPFYGLAIMIFIFPTSMMLYYIMTFGSLFVLFLLRKKLGRFMRS